MEKPQETREAGPEGPEGNAFAMKAVSGISGQKSSVDVIGIGDMLRESPHLTTRCPKCGRGMATIEWHPNRYACSAWRNIYDMEHMHLRCNTCGYEWIESPLDQQMPVEEPPKS